MADLNERIDAAVARLASARAGRDMPLCPSDDFERVLADCKARIEELEHEVRGARVSRDGHMRGADAWQAAAEKAEAKLAEARGLLKRVAIAEQPPLERNYPLVARDIYTFLAAPEPEANPTCSNRSPGVGAYACILPSGHIGAHANGHTEWGGQELEAKLATHLHYGEECGCRSAVARPAEPMIEDHPFRAWRGEQTGQIHECGECGQPRARHAR